MITVILPAYNEQQALPPLLDALAQVRAFSLPDLRVIVVDDGSTDRTAEVVRERAAVHPWIELVQHGRNRGLGAGLRTGFEAALKDAAPDDIVVTLDADNTQPPALIPRMVEAIGAGGDVVIASRYRRGAAVRGVPFMRRVFSRGMGILFGLLFRVKGVRDYSCGFRAYRAGVLLEAQRRYGDGFITEAGFACMIEILFQLDALGSVRFGEVPLVLRYDLKPTATKMDVGKTVRQTLAVAARHRLRRRPPAPR